MQRSKYQTSSCFEHYFEDPGLGFIHLVL